MTERDFVKGPAPGRGLCLTGVPYARFESAVRLFGAPSPVDPSAMGDCVEMSQFPQSESRLTSLMGSPPQHRDIGDSLSLNIWGPVRAAGQKYPVLIWIHGGGWVSGSASWPWYDARQFAEEQGAIVVTMNYRLGLWGFLDLENENRGDSPGLDRGSQDQLLAFEWVLENIEALGGDPAEITLAGQSAGAFNAALLASRPQVNARIRRLLLQSAPLGIPFLTSAQAGAIAETCGSELGRRGHTPAPSGLLSASTAELLKITAKAAAIHASDNRPGVPTFRPRSPLGGDAASIQDLYLHPPEALQPVDVMIGTTSNEMAAFMNGADGDAIAAETAALFTSPADDLSRLLAGRGNTVIRYEYGTPVEKLDACHCSDLPYWFGTWAAWRQSPLLAGVGRGLFQQRATEYRTLVGRFLRGEYEGIKTTENIDVGIPTERDSRLQRASGQR